MKTSTCGKHGFFTEENAVIEKDTRYKDGYKIRCKLCREEQRIRTYNKHKDARIKYVKEWKDKNKERLKEQQSIDYKNNPEKYRKWSKQYKDLNREKISTLEICRVRQISVKDYEAMVKHQNGKCAICKLEETRMARNGNKTTRLCLDHDHDTGKIRGLLCHDCNSALGKFKDSIETLIFATIYLMDHEEKPIG